MTGEIPVMRAVGERVRAIRTDSGRRQDDVALAARVVGLDWTRDTVAAIERGGRGLQLGELLLLPLVLHLACLVEVELADLLPPDTDIEVRLGIVVNSDVLRKSLLGRSAELQMSAVRTQPPLYVTRASRPEAERRVLELVASADSRRDEEGGGQQSLVSQLISEAAGEAERKAARQLGVGPLVVALASNAAFGRSLTAERDARVERVAEESTPARKLQALRGHETRRLIRELAPYFDKDTGDLVRQLVPVPQEERRLRRRGQKPTERKQRKREGSRSR